MSIATPFPFVQGANALQRRMRSQLKVAYLGPPGTFTEVAARQAHPAADFLPVGSIEAVFAAVRQGAASLGVVPIDNVIEGVVTETFDSLFDHAEHVRMVDLLICSIEHALGALPGHGPITRILSKDQALKQCSTFLRNRHSAAQWEFTASTAAAIEAVATAGNPEWAAVGTQAALQARGLSVLAQGIGDVPHNQTRFAVLAPTAAPWPSPSGDDACAVAIYPRHDRIGLLHGLLGVISHDHGLSCSSIHSRPDRHGAYRFYLEIEGHLQNSRVAACLASLRSQSSDAGCDIRVFGTYPQRRFNPRRIATIGIIGGTGAMGRWFETFFRRAGYAVLVSGRRTELSYEACAQRSDVLLINVPIAVTETVIRSIAPHVPVGRLLVDNTSIKEMPVATMLAVAAPGVEVLGMHTVFGPAVASAQGQNIIFTPTSRCGHLSEEFEAVFRKFGARVTRTDPAHHDRQMALHQNLEHFTKLVLARLIAAAGPGATDDLDRYASPNSRASLASMGRILRADPGLFAEIQLYNREGPAALRAFCAVAEDVVRQVETGDANTLAELVATVRAQLGEKFLQSLAERSQRMDTT